MQSIYTLKKAKINRDDVKTRRFCHAIANLNLGNMKTRRNIYFYLLNAFTFNILKKCYIWAVFRLALSELAFSIMFRKMINHICTSDRASNFRFFFRWIGFSIRLNNIWRSVLDLQMFDTDQIRLCQAVVTQLMCEGIT